MIEKLNLEKYLNFNGKVKPMTIYEMYNIPVESGPSIEMGVVKLIDSKTGRKLMDRLGKELEVTGSIILPKTKENLEFMWNMYALDVPSFDYIKEYNDKIDLFDLINSMDKYELVDENSEGVFDL